MEKSVLTDLVLPIALAIIMLGMGLSLTLPDFKRVIKFPRAIFLGLFNQLILLPLVAFLLIQLFGLTEGLAIGMLVIAACPGGTTSNIITHVSKGDTALSVTLTAISTLITVFSIPILVNFGIEKFSQGNVNIQLPMVKTILELILITLFPVSIGMVIKKMNNSFAQKAEKPVKIFSIVIFVVLVLGIILKNKEHIVHYFKTAGLVALSLNVITMMLGYFLSKMVKLNTKQSITISIESGIQNGTLALLITLSLIENRTVEMSIAPAVYSIIMFITGGFVMGYFGRKKATNPT